MTEACLCWMPVLHSENSAGSRMLGVLEVPTMGVEVTPSGEQGTRWAGPGPWYR